MHRYQPRLHVLHNRPQSQTNSRDEPGNSFQAFKTFIFQETQFTAVTAYQNHRVSQIVYISQIETLQNNGSCFSGRKHSMANRYFMKERRETVAKFK